MKVVVFSGGTGSVQLHKGLKKYFKLEDINVIINAYDNGLSTGVCRKVLDGKILGPSDLRKVQMLHAELYETCPKPLLDFLNKRAYAENPEDMFNKINDEAFYLLTNEIITKEQYEFIKDATFSFLSYNFSIPDCELVTSNAWQVKFDDFSYSNIIYSGCAADNDFSLSVAGAIIAMKLLNIPQQSVTLISDQSLYLQALTQSGHIILDEGDIVSWNNAEDKITNIQLVDATGDVVVPKVCNSSKELIANADLIIFSSGTQWSSLIPSYIHDGFYDAIKNAKANKYLVMNLTQDKDMEGVNSGDILNILKGYLPINQITSVFSTNAVEEMSVKKVDMETIISKNFIEMNAEPIGLGEKNVHNGIKLTEAILRDCFNSLLKTKHKLFDFDDTLVARFSNIQTSFENFLNFLSNPSYSIVTGNSKKHIEEKIKWIKVHNDPKIENSFFCDGGNAIYKWSDNEKCLKFEKYVNAKYVFTNEQIKTIVDKLTALINIPVWKIENRANCVISIKPVTGRPAIIEKIQKILGTDYSVHATGNTTIDIMIYRYDKSVVLQYFDVAEGISFFGDEFHENGNDECMKNNHGVTCYAVKTVEDTNVYLKLLESWKIGAKH